LFGPMSSPAVITAHSLRIVVSPDPASRPTESDMTRGWREARRRSDEMRCAFAAGRHRNADCMAKRRRSR